MLCFLLLAETQHRRASSCHAPKRYVVGVGRSVVKFLSGLHSSSGLQRVSARVWFDRSFYYYTPVMQQAGTQTTQHTTESHSPLPCTHIPAGRSDTTRDTQI